MKKRISILLLTILAAFLFTACGGAGGFAAVNDTAMWSEPAAPQSMPVPQAEEYRDELALFAVLADSDDSYNYSMGGAAGGADYGGSNTSGSGSIVPVNSQDNEGLAEKIIYSVHVNIETIQFDETIAKVNQMLTTYNAFIESSSVSGINYESRFYGWNEFRYAYFNIRVPVNQLNSLTDNLDNLGNVTHRSNDAVNITTQFTDTQSRLNSLHIQEERLLDMLSKAEDVPDLIMIEERLSEVRYQVEMLTTMLTGWQRQVDYSTVTLSIREVEEFTEQPKINVSYWQQIANGFMATMRSIGQFFMDIFKWLIVSAPVLIMIAVIILVVLILIRQKIRSIKKKKEAQESENNE